MRYGFGGASPGLFVGMAFMMGGRGPPARPPSCHRGALMGRLQGRPPASGVSPAPASVASDPGAAVGAPGSAAAAAVVVGAVTTLEPPGVCCSAQAAAPIRRTGPRASAARRLSWRAFMAELYHGPAGSAGARGG